MGILLAVLLSACGSGGAPPPAPAPTPAAAGAGPEPGPIAGLATNAWTWVDFPGSRCDDGTPTGIGVSPGDGPDLLVYFDGGGACWSHETCAVEDTSRHGPFGRAELLARARHLSGSVFDRADPANPFRAFSFVFVPYCTGDVHSGDRATTYSGPGGARTLQHRGRANALIFLPRIAATFPAPRRLVVAGSSAGGYGTLVNYDAYRARWPRARGYAIDDAGPALRGLPAPPLRDAWWSAWASPAALASFCPECAADVSAAWAALSRRWPGDRIALLSSLRDRTMRGYLDASPAAFERAVRDTAAEVIAPLPNVRAFLVPGESHTMLDDVAAFSASGTPLASWLARMIGDDPAWSSRGP
jgi:hypothetical protein